MRIDELNNFSEWRFVTGPVIAVKRKDNKFLLLKRSKKERFPDLWEFPSGGLEFLETLEDAAYRELKEEAGLKAKSIKYLGYHERIRKEIKRQIVAHDFLVTDFKGKVKLSDEHQDYKWVTKKEILKMGKKVGDNTIAVLKKLSVE